MKSRIAFSAIVGLIAAVAAPAQAQVSGESPAKTAVLSEKGTSSAKPLVANPDNLARTLNDLHSIAKSNGGDLAAGTTAHDSAVKYIKRRFEDYGYEVRLDPVGRGRIQTYNVVAYWPGENLENAVLVGANFTSAPGSPGADVVGSGAAAMLETARDLVASRRLQEKPVRFVLFGNKAGQLDGLRQYRDRSRDNLSDIHSYHHVQQIGTRGSVSLITSATSSRMSPHALHLKRLWRKFDRDLVDGRHATFLFRGEKPSTELSTRGGENGCVHASCDTVDRLDLDLLVDNATAFIRAVWTDVNVFAVIGYPGPWGGAYAVSGPKSVTKLGVGSKHFVKFRYDEAGGNPPYFDFRYMRTPKGVTYTAVNQEWDSQSVETTATLQAGPDAAPGLHMIPFGWSRGNLTSGNTFVIDIAGRNGRSTCGHVDRTNTVFHDEAPAVLKANMGWCSGKASAKSRLGLDMLHRFRGDVEAWLVAPSGRRYNVFTAVKDTAPMMPETYTLDLSREKAGGQWTLEMSDSTWLHDGEIRGWYLDLG